MRVYQRLSKRKNRVEYEWSRPGNLSLCLSMEITSWKRRARNLYQASLYNYFFYCFAFPSIRDSVTGLAPISLSYISTYGDLKSPRRTGMSLCPDQSRPRGKGLEKHICLINRRIIKKRRIFYLTLKYPPPSPQQNNVKLGSPTAALSLS